jgi:P4 family phage/plasmid primase-like protien
MNRPICPYNIPNELQETARFLLWKLFENKGGKQFKSPISHSGYRVSYDSPDALMSFEAIKNRITVDNDVGIGISLKKDGLSFDLMGVAQYLWCLDFDGFVEFGGDRCDDGLIEIMNELASYAEISPSTTGLKVFLLSDKKPESKSHIRFSPSEFAETHPGIKKYERREVEVFSKGLYLALTGDLWSSKYQQLRVTTKKELDGLLAYIDDAAIKGGGKGAGEMPSLTVVQKRAEGAMQVYSKLTPESLELALAYVDHCSESVWSDTANALARAYGEDGRQFFIGYSRGDYAGVEYKDFNLEEVENRFKRAIREVRDTPRGYGVKRLVEVAEHHPDWLSPNLEYEVASPFPDSEGYTPFPSRDHEQSETVALDVGSTDEQTPSDRVSGTLDKVPSIIDRTDIRNGERFREQYSGELLFVRDTSDVLRFDEDRGWVRGNSDLPLQSAKAVVVSMTEACAKALQEGRDAKPMLAEVKRSSSRRALDDMLKLAKSEEGMSVALSELDNDPYLLGVQNGVVDLRRGSLLAPNPAVLVTKHCNVAYDPQASCPRFCAFLEEVVPNQQQRDFLVTAMGYFLTGLTKEQLWFFFHGVGSNGKSVLIGLLENLMGDYVVKIQTEMLMQHYKAPSGASPELLQLQGKRLVFCNETKEGQRLDDAHIKDLTGGDTITGRPLFRNNHISFSPTHKLVVVGNHRPIVSDNSHGFWRRVVLYPFDVCIPEEHQDKDLLEQLIGEGSGILNHLLDALRVYFRRGLSVPDSLLRGTAEYRTDQDMVLQFLNDQCAIDTDKEIKKEILYRKYHLWCEDSGLHALSANRFSRQVTAKGFELKTDKRTWVGIA